MKHEHQRSVSIGASMKLVLLRISWCHLVMLHAGVSNKGHTVDVCRKFLSMMMILGITGLDLQLREAIVEYLFGVDPDSFAAASDNDGSYVRAALSWIHMTIEQNQSDDAVCEDVPLSLKTVMQTLTLLLQRGSKILQDPRPRPDLIQTLMSFAARWSHVPSLYQAILGDLCVMAASFYPGLPGDVRSIETDKVERIILVVGALAQRDCFLDAALANMIATQVEHCRTDALLRYEMMDTLCDALMVVLCHTTGDYRLWSCGLAICRALKPLVVNFQHESQVFGSFRIGKMLSLIDERSHNGDHDTDASLRGFRLACGVIAKMITGDYKKEASPQEPRADEPATDKYPTRLVLTSVDGVSRMIHVPSSLL
ncbi:hypothetical protein SISSUDRAFT_1038913 [Sistotremastrum suecicum HHB10207 ss-3]|uniref:Uncharacterized protein n=1 Tax=Sistotremastrum suecicum HHB10207 ss-3 TaxID=1314776 RepID=A0A166J5X0_9AGAM|nr:hypothetical protein SISSUDRAFT_1038913 [Sistotremastrum suecicum HHB10207 ss-3]